MGCLCDNTRDKLVDNIVHISYRSQSFEELNGDNVCNSGNCFTFAFGLYNGTLKAFHEDFEGILPSNHELIGNLGQDLSKQIVPTDDATTIEEKRNILCTNVFNFINQKLNNYIRISDTKKEYGASLNTDWAICVLFGKYGHHYLRSKDHGKTWYCKDGRNNFLYKPKSELLEFYKTKYNTFVCYFEIEKLDKGEIL